MSYKFFENKDCKYYPCHKLIDKINCLFCYCPLYHTEGCKFGRRCKDCTFPHKEENYEVIIDILRKYIQPELCDSCGQPVKHLPL